MQKIIASVVVNSNIKNTWEKWSSPEAIKAWCHASDDWAVGDVQNDLRVGGRFLTNMRSVDNTQSFDFTGTYLDVVDGERMRYLMDGEDKRECEVTFEKVSENETRVTETFDPESINPADMQQAGWQATLDNFKKYAEGK